MLIGFATRRKASFCTEIKVHVYVYPEKESVKKFYKLPLEKSNLKSGNRTCGDWNLKSGNSEQPDETFTKLVQLYTIRYAVSSYCAVFLVSNTFRNGALEPDRGTTSPA